MIRISYSAAAWPSGLGAGFSPRRWSRCGFESRCGHFLFFFFAHFFCLVFVFFVYIFSLWLVFLYSHPWAFTASRDFRDNSFLVNVRWWLESWLEALARYFGILIPPQVFWIFIFVPRSRHFPIVLGTFSALFWIWSSILHFQHSWTLSWLLSRNWAFFTFWATIKHFNFFFFTIFHMLNAICCLWNVFSKPSSSLITNLNN